MKRRDFLRLGVMGVLGVGWNLEFKTSARAASGMEITIGYLVASQLHNPIEMIMREKKLLEAEGIKVKWNEFIAGAYLMQHMASGEVDFGTLGVVPVMISKSQGINVVMLAGSNTEGSALVASLDIKSIKDLDGKKIGTPGIGSLQDNMLRMLARKNNIKIQQMGLNVSDMPIFLSKKEIDGFIAWEPHPSRAVDSGYGHLLATSHDMLPGHQCCVFVAKGELIRKNPELVRKVIKVYVKTFDHYFDLLKKNPEELIDLTAKYTGMSKKVIEMSMKTLQIPYPPYANVPDLKLQAEGLIKDGKITKVSVTNVDNFIASIYDPSFVNENLGKKGK